MFIVTKRCEFVIKTVIVFAFGGQSNSKKQGSYFFEYKDRSSKILFATFFTPNIDTHLGIPDISLIHKKLFMLPKLDTFFVIIPLIKYMMLHNDRVK